jgi:hypothetical protein
MLEILGYIIYYKVLSLFLKPDISLIADNLILDLLDAVLAGLDIIDKVASNPSIILYLSLTKGINTG